MHEITARPPRIAFKPDRITSTPSGIAASPPDWTIENITAVQLIHEDLLAGAYSDRRVAARKIRQQRRKLRRVNRECGHAPGEGVSESILRATIVV